MSVPIGLLGVLPAVQLDYQLSFQANEVHDEGPEWVLAAELEPAQLTVSQAFPREPFRVGHLMTEFTGTLVGHDWLTPTLTLPPKGGGNKAKTVAKAG